jgi:DNA-binding LacI/PurR family transcriptional regulator
VFVGNDQMSLSVLQMACRRGIQVPRDLAVVGFDGLPESAHYWPPLTTMYQDLRTLGCTAVQELVRAIEAGRDEQLVFEPRSISHRPELIVRESSIGHQGPNRVQLLDGGWIPAMEMKQNG